MQIFSTLLNLVMWKILYVTKCSVFCSVWIGWLMGLPGWILGSWVHKSLRAGPWLAGMGWDQPMVRVSDPGSACRVAGSGSWFHGVDGSMVQATGSGLRPRISRVSAPVLLGPLLRRVPSLFPGLSSPEIMLLAHRKSRHWRR
jgi:hypothetical protein